MITYHIQITNGVISYDYTSSPEYSAKNAKQYFAARGQKKPAPVLCKGWPFAKMYITHGTEENGEAVAWPSK